MILSLLAYNVLDQLVITAAVRDDEPLSGEHHWYPVKVFETVQLSGQSIADTLEACGLELLNAAAAAGAASTPPQRAAGARSWPWG